MPPSKDRGEADLKERKELPQILFLRQFSDYILKSQRHTVGERRFKAVYICPPDSESL